MQYKIGTPKTRIRQVDSKGARGNEAVYACQAKHKHFCELTSETIPADTVELGDEVGNLLDGLDLLLEVLGLDKIAELRVVVLLCDLVKVKQALVDIYQKWSEQYVNICGVS